MAGPEFHQTPRGARFFDVTMPRIADELANLNNNLSALLVLVRTRLPSAPKPPDTDATAPVPPKR